MAITNSFEFLHFSFAQFFFCSRQLVAADKCNTKLFLNVFCYRMRPNELYKLSDSLKINSCAHFLLYLLGPPSVGCGDKIVIRVDICPVVVHVVVFRITCLLNINISLGSHAHFVHLFIHVVDKMISILTFILGIHIGIPVPW